jgi:hypothetical protein
MLDESDMLRESDMLGDRSSYSVVTSVDVDALCRHKELDVHFCAESPADEAHSEDTMRWVACASTSHVCVQVSVGELLCSWCCVDLT